MDLFGKKYHAPGTMPGLLSGVKPGDFDLILIDYDEETYVEEKNLTPSECKSYIDTPSNTWIHIQGTPSVDALQNLSEAFELHALHLEDILNTGQRPKLDVIGKHTFVILGLPTLEDGRVVIAQICLFLGDGFVISFCTRKLNPFSPIYKRLQTSSGKLRSRSVGFLFYTLIDTVIDYGFPLLEFYAERIEDIEESLVTEPDAVLLQDIHKVRRELLLLRRTLSPHREIISGLLRDEGHDNINDEIRIYLRDCYDHTISIWDMVETYREMAATMLEVYLSSISNRLNEVMRVLTVIATLFIPPTFVVGVYGMNFDRNAGYLNMPELGWPFGYVFVWIIILTMISGMLLYFRRKGWF